MDQESPETNIWGTTRTMEEVVGANLTRYRHREDITQAELGRRIGAAGKPWSRQAVSLAEAGKRAFGVTDLVTISYGTNMTMTDLLTIAEDVDSIDLGGEVPISTVSIKARMGLTTLTLEKVRELELVGRSRAIARMQKFVNKWAAEVENDLDDHRAESTDADGGEH